MPIDRARAREHLKLFNFRKLFLEEMGWDKFDTEIHKQIDGTNYTFKGFAEKRGVAAFYCPALPPDYGTRLKLDKAIAKDHFQHLLVFGDKVNGRQIWQWMRRESGKPHTIRTFSYSVNQAGELLLQKLDQLVFSIEEEEAILHGHVVSRMDDVARVEKITKKFYERFKIEHDRFLKFIDGIPDEQMEAWYASVMINRLMFLYFIQAKGFLNNDADYLRNKLKESGDRKKDGYYRDFLSPLFFEGFARKKEDRSSAVNKLLGSVPYLNGGLFQRHQIEELHGKKIHIPDAAFTRLFDFFKDYNWHLDERENQDDKEINPDVLGYIFEKYINDREQMGAYYTKEDITGYISQNTVIPFLLDTTRKACAIAFDKTAGIWRLLRDDPDRYLYADLRHGTVLELPQAIASGLTEVNKRSEWNRMSPREYALPTETWRDVVDRRLRCSELRQKVASGGVSEVNDLVTLNLDIRQFAQDVIQYCEGPELLRAIYKAISKVSVLDPTCGSGAFLFAALNVLKPLYEACLQRMQMFLDECDGAVGQHPKKFEDFREVLTESKKHPKQDYFILKSIIVNNLFGVDLMEEAVEICKLRLFLKLVAHVDATDRIEPLPDIDFNICTGNALVGYAKYDDVQKAVKSKLDFEDSLAKIEDKAKILDAAVRRFRAEQTRPNGVVTAQDKHDLRARFGELEGELNDFLSAESVVKPSGVSTWVHENRPFHWFSNFHQLMNEGGFDVAIGNPPYVELKEVDARSISQYKCFSAGNLYALMLERSTALVSREGRLGFIVPVSSISTDRYNPLQKLLASRKLLVYSSYDDRPSRLFDGLEHIRLTIHLFSQAESKSPEYFSSRYNKWASQARPQLFSTLSLQQANPGLVPGTMPKLCSRLEPGIALKLAAEKSQLGLSLRKRSQHEIYYSRKVGYFLQVLNFEPVVLDGKGQKRPPSEFKTLFFDSVEAANATLCALNSNLFYWFVTVFSDCRHLNKREIEAFPIKIEKAIGNSAAALRFNDLAERLMADILANSERRVMRFKHDTLTVQCIFPRLSKPIIDEIDTALAAHYGFNDEELDFIVNYDIKYRLGSDADEG